MLASTRSLVLALVLPLASALACAPEQAGPPPNQGEPPPAPVEVARARSGELVDAWVFVGEVRSLRAAELALGAGGEIIHIEVREGDRVEAGAVLVEIDKRQASARLSAAVSGRHESERELEQARREAERAAALGSEVLAGEIIEQQASRAETLEARKRRLGAEISAAKAQLSDYRLVAPFAGVIAARHADLGQWLDPGETVLELVATDEVEILVEVRPELAAQLRRGAEVTLRPAGGVLAVGSSEASTGPAEILGVVPSLDPSTRTLKVRLRPTQPRAWLLPGAPVEVAFPVRYQTGPGAGSEGESVIVPRDALVLGAVDTRVIVIEGEQAKPIQVEVRAQAGDEALVVGAGLGPDAVVVTRGNERLRPGQRVRVIDGAAGEEPAA